MLVAAARMSGKVGGSSLEAAVGRMALHITRVALVTIRARAVCPSCGWTALMRVVGARVHILVAPRYLRRGCMWVCVHVLGDLQASVCQLISLSSMVVHSAGRRR